MTSDTITRVPMSVVDVADFSADATGIDVAVYDDSECVFTQFDVKICPGLLDAAVAGLDVTQFDSPSSYAKMIVLHAYDDVTRQALRHLTLAPVIDRFHVTEAAAALVQRPEPPRPYTAFTDLARWLGATNPEISQMLGIKPTTHYAWRSRNASPRPATVRGVLQHHNLLGSLRRRMGVAEFDWWLNSGDPPHRDRLLAGGLASMRPAIYDVVFAGSDPEPMIAEPEPVQDASPSVELDLGAWITADDELAGLE